MTARLRLMARHPVAAFRGACQFREWWVTIYPDDDRFDAFEAGRELAHRLTFHRFDRP